MSSALSTVPRLSPHLPVQGFRALVAGGPDRGLHVDAEDGSLTVGTAQGNSLVLSDPAVSRYHLELVSSEEGIVVLDRDSTNGSWLGTALIKQAVVQPETVLQLGDSQLRVVGAGQKMIELYTQDTLGAIRGRSAVMRRLMARLRKVAPSQAGVLVIGETGTGKELIARALHDESGRADGPFVTVDCAALTPTLVASELFGHERGAFTGATKQHQGAFERASGGTVFLDEIGELPPELQRHLLGVLERRRIQRVGGSKLIPIDVRVVSATNRDLRSNVNAGTFRGDLYYRLAVVGVDVPPLRERPDDIPLLVEHFLRECGYEEPIRKLFPQSVMRRFQQYAWPGNIRELRNVVEATLAEGELVRLNQNTMATQEPGLTSIPVALQGPYKDARTQLLHGFESRYLEWLMNEASDNVSRAARIARMTRSHLFELLRRHNLR